MFHTKFVSKGDILIIGKMSCDLFTIADIIIIFILPFPFNLKLSLKK